MTFIEIVLGVVDVVGIAVIVTLTYKYSQLVAKVESNVKFISLLKENEIIPTVKQQGKDIEHLSGIQEKQQEMMNTTLNKILDQIGEMNTNVKLLTQRMDYVEKLKEGKANE